MSKLFIYGSYSEGMVHFRKIEKFVESMEEAEITASLYQLEVGYPVIVEGGETTVSGHVVELKSSEMLFKLLDEWHGVIYMNPEKSLFHRKEIEIDGSIAQVYFMNPKKLKKAELIVDGDWQSRLQPMTENLSDRQISYIEKLAKAGRREVMPYDLELCRGLERAKIIVDKGRRFALTRLGQEIYRYL